MHLSAKRAVCTLKQENVKLIWGQNKILVKELPGGEGLWVLGREEM